MVTFIRAAKSRADCASWYLARAVRQADLYALTRDPYHADSARRWWAAGAAMLRDGAHGACCTVALTRGGD